MMTSVHPRFVGNFHPKVLRTPRGIKDSLNLNLKLLEGKSGFLG